MNVCQRTWSNNKEQWAGTENNGMFGQTQNHETNTKMHAPSNNDSKPQIHIKSNRKHLYETSNPKNAHEHEKQCKLQANCNTDSYATKHPKAQGMSRGCRGDRGDAEQAVATSRRHRKPQEPKGSLGGSGKARKLGRLKHLEALGSILGWPQATWKNSKKHENI